MHHKSEMQRVIDNLLTTRAFNSRAFLLFGHCNATEEMADYLLSRNIVPAAILDNSNAKQGLLYRQIPIISPDMLKKHTSSSSIILIASRFYSEMHSQCRQLGYDGEIVKVVDYNTFAEYSLSEDTIRRKTERMERGKVTLNKIRTEYPSEHLVICPNKALGDVYWAMAFLPQYCQKKDITDVSVVVVGNACRQVVEMFNIENVIILDKVEMDEFVQAVIYTHERNSIIANHDLPYTDNIIKWLDKHFLSFIDYYRCAVYGLPKETLPVSPREFESFDNAPGINKGRSVIISPFAKSVVSLPDGFWRELIDDYKSKGYSVYTSIAGVEKPLEGTLPISTPVFQMISAIEYANTFVGLRNGLCDILNSADCDKIVLFPDCYYSTTPHKVADFFDLPGWRKRIIDTHSMS